MILRIVTGRVPPDLDVAALVARRDELTRIARSITGLESLIIGARATPGTPHDIAGPPPALPDAPGRPAAIVAVWRDVESMARTAAGEPEAGDDRFVSGFLGLPFRPTAPLAYELVDRRFGALPPEGRAVLRILTLRSRVHEEAQLLEVLRARQPRLIPLGLVGSQVGRRLVPGGEVEAVVVALWPDHATIAAATGPDTDVPQPAELEAWADRTTVDAYDAIEIAPRIPAISGPPIFVIDDDLRIVDITPSAAAMLGLPATDLVGVRVDEMTGTARARATEVWQALRHEGTVQGETSWRVPDVGSISLRYVARADIPIPGRHTVYVRRQRDAEPTPEDLDAAIADAFGRT